MRAVQDIVIKFAGDSGDGMQLMGTQFANNTAMAGYLLLTFPDFPAEIRAPQGTLAGVSGFQMRAAPQSVFSVGEHYDILVAMNAAALKNELPYLKKNALLVWDEAGFELKNLKSAGYAPDYNPVVDERLRAQYQCWGIPVTKLTREALQDTKLTMKERDRAKNMFVLGFLYWLFETSLAGTKTFLQQKFKGKPELLAANILVLEKGYHYGDITEALPRYTLLAQKTRAGRIEKGIYRNISGNTALVYGLLAAAARTKRTLFLGSYPITPASDILHLAAQLTHFPIKIFQAEDEIAAVGAAVGASYAGDIGVTATSGPGMDLKTETIGLAVSLELPLLIINVQRAGPSTGMPTKVEQADLWQAFYGRHGEAPLPVVAPATSADAFFTAYDALRLAIMFMTPVILLSDANIGNGIQSARVPDWEKLPEITAPDSEMLPFQRDDKGVRAWIIPGTAEKMYRIGGLEKDQQSGRISYDGANHEQMVRLRAQKIARIAEFIPEQKLCLGETGAEVALVGWGSTYGVVYETAAELQEEGYSVAHVSVTYLNPFPKNLLTLLRTFQQIVVAEGNTGQLRQILQANLSLSLRGYNELKGKPLSKQRLKDYILSLFKQKLKNDAG